MTAHPLNIRLPSSNFQSSPVTVQSDGLYDCSLGRRKVDSRYTTMINQSTFLLPVRLPSSVMMARTNRAVIGVIGTRSRLVSAGHGGPSVCLDISRVRLAFTLTHSFTHARTHALIAHKVSDSGVRSIICGAMPDSRAETTDPCDGAKSCNLSLYSSF